MERVIKFRAFVGSSMVYEGFHISAPGMPWEWVTFPSNSKSVDYPIMQFTGLTDKNGIEIYEGDIVKCKPNKVEFIGLIRYDVYRSKFVVDLPSATNEIATWDDFLAKNTQIKGIEVIGNIHQNRELLTPPINT